MSLELLKKFKGSRCWSDINTEEVNVFLNSNQSNFKNIVALAINNEENYSWRAAWLISGILNNDDKRLSSFILKIIKSIPGKKSGHQRELLKIISKFKLSQKQEGYLLDICINLWKDINLKSGTRYYAMLLILKISQRYPDIRNEINYLLEDYYTNNLSPGIKCNVLKKAKKETHPNDK
tara:strand:- start:533 stop:1069 length:537 start_codon:yes stop_codon:yes gene_type:complete